MTPPSTPDIYSLLASTGTGDDEIVYIFGYDDQSALFFNIVTDPSSTYVVDGGTFAAPPDSAGAVPNRRSGHDAGRIRRGRASGR